MGLSDQASDAILNQESSRDQSQDEKPFAGPAVRKHRK